MDPFLGAAASTFVAALLGVAALHKLRDIGGFRRTLERYRLLPRPLVPSFAFGLPMLEIGIASSLPLEVSRSVAGAAAAILFALYAAAISINLVRGRRDLACGCGFGIDRREDGESISEALVARNLALVTLSALIATTVASRPITWFDDVAGTAAGTSLLLLWITAGRLLANRRTIAARSPT